MAWSSVFRRIQRWTLRKLNFDGLYPRSNKPAPHNQYEARPAGQKEKVWPNSPASGLTQHLRGRTKIQQANEEQMVLTFILYRKYITLWVWSFKTYSLFTAADVQKLHTTSLKDMSNCLSGRRFLLVFIFPGPCILN